MATRRQKDFKAKVAQAARDAKPKRRRGRATPANLTDEVRYRGLLAMRKAPRCRAKRRDGMDCQGPALRGSTRCLKHGGRVEVPGYPHNIRRFFQGSFERPAPQLDDGPSDREIWQSFTFMEKRELLGILSDQVIKDDRRFHHAARVWEAVRDGTYLQIQAFMRQFART